MIGIWWNYLFKRINATPVMREGVCYFGDIVWVVSSIQFEISIADRSLYTRTPLSTFHTAFPLPQSRELAMSFSSLPRSLLLLSLGIVLGTSTTYLLTHHRHNRAPPADDQALSEDIVDGIEGLIGSTKLVRIRSLSSLTGCEILAKAEVPLLLLPIH
jgi:hypothetical protein